MMKRVFLSIFILLTLVQFGATQSSGNTCSLISKDDGTQTDNCPYLYSCQEGVCMHNSIFEFPEIEIVGIILSVIITGLASAGGIGGGTILTPVLLIFFRYVENIAIMAVYAMIFGGSIGNFMNTGLKRDAKTNKPYLSYDLSLICMPPMLLGTSIGVLINKAMAPIVIVVGIVLLTIYTLTKVSIKAKKEFKKETDQLKSASFESSGLSTNGTGESLIAAISDYTESAPLDDQLEKIVAEEMKLVPIKKFSKIAGLLLFMILMAILRGTQNFPSPVGASFCGAGYWGIFAIGILGCLICAVWNRKTLLNSIKLKETLNYVDKDDGFVLQKKQIPFLFVLSLVAGVLAGMFGIGGGMIMSPTLLGLGLNPMALTATSGFFVVQTSFISLVSAALYKEVPLSVYGFFFVICLVGSFVVSWSLLTVAKKFKRPSIILISLVFILIVSLIATPVFELTYHWHDLLALFKFKDLC